MRGVFEDLFASAGAALDDHLKLKPLSVLARHAWADGARLDLTADVEENADAIGALAGADEARGYRAFAARGARMFEGARSNFHARLAAESAVAGQRASADWIRRSLGAISPFETLWSALGAHFRDARLRQLFGRYATYCGASPFLAPATLMLVAEVERRGVWRIEGGMRPARRRAARRRRECWALEFRFGVEVASVIVERG